MYFLSESYGHGSFNRSMKCWVDLRLYCHTSVSEVVVELLQHHRLLGI